MAVSYPLPAQMKLKRNFKLALIQQSTCSGLLKSMGLKNTCVGALLSQSFNRTQNVNEALEFMGKCDGLLGCSLETRPRLVDVIGLLERDMAR